MVRDRSTLDVLDDRVLELLDEELELEPIGSGLTLTEGPVWIASERCLLFSDVKACRRYRWDQEGGVTEVCAETNFGNGMTIDLAGRLVVCEGGAGCVSRMDATGDGSGREIVASHFGGRRLNSPNDVVVRSDGSVYFTDNWYGHKLGIEVERELDFQGVYRVPPEGGEPILLVDDMIVPNGLCFTPDESVLCVADSERGWVRAFDVAPDGSVANDRVHVEGLNGPTYRVDGMKCDERGNVWITGRDGLRVLDPSGAELGVIRTPERCLNVHWGGPEWSWLFLTATTMVFRIATKVSGRREPFMTVGAGI